MKIAWAVLLVVATSACAQQSLKVKEPVHGELSSGSVSSYAIELRTGDYVSGLLDQHGKIDLTIFAPDGSPVRRFPAPAEDGTRLWVFIADSAGAYRIEAATTATQSVRFELTLNQVLPLDERLKPKPWQDLNPSPRIDALRKQVAAGNADLEAFWKQVASEGTPLAESIDKDPQHQLVTFLWRGNAETRNVFPVGRSRSGASIRSIMFFTRFLRRTSGT